MPTRRTCSSTRSADSDQEASRIDALYAAEVARLDAWKDDRMHGIQYETGAGAPIPGGVHVRAWHATNPRTKTANLPNGKLTLRDVKGHVEVTDREAFVAWAKVNRREDLIRYVPEPAKAVLSDEDVVIRHTGPQVSDPKNGRTAPRPTGSWCPSPPARWMPTANRWWRAVSAPGVAFVKPAHDRFDMTPTNDQPQENAS